MRSFIQQQNCLVPRRLSLDENVRAKEGGKETTGETALHLPSVPFPWSLAVHHQSLAFCARLYDEKNEAPEEEAGKRIFDCRLNCNSHHLLRAIVHFIIVSGI